MKNLGLLALMLMTVPSLALAGAGSYSGAYSTQTCSGVFSVDGLKTSRPAGVSTVQMLHISALSRAQQQELATKKGSGSLEAEFHLGSDNCWYMLLKTMSSGRSRTTTYTDTSTGTTSTRTGSFSTYFYGQGGDVPSRTSSSTTGRAITSTTFRTSSDINFSLYDVIVLEAVPADANMTIAYASMTEAQQLSLRAFYGSAGEGATIYRRDNGVWYIVLSS